MRDASSHPNYISHLPPKSINSDNISPTSPSTHGHPSSLLKPSLFHSLLEAVSLGASSVPTFITSTFKHGYSFPPTTMASHRRRRHKLLPIGQLSDRDPLVQAEETLLQHKVVSVLVLVGIILLILMGGAAIVALEVPARSDSHNIDQLTSPSLSEAGGISQQSITHTQQESDLAMMRAMHENSASTHIVTEHAPEHSDDFLGSSHEAPNTMHLPPSSGEDHSGSDEHEIHEPPHVDDLPAAVHRENDVGNTQEAELESNSEAVSEGHFGDIDGTQPRHERSTSASRRAGRLVGGFVGGVGGGFFPVPVQNTAHDQEKAERKRRKLSDLKIAPAVPKPTHGYTSMGGPQLDPEDKALLAAHGASTLSAQKPLDASQNKNKRRYGPLVTIRLKSHTPLFLMSNSHEPLGELAEGSMLALADNPIAHPDAQPKPVNGRVRIFFQSRDIRAALDGSYTNIIEQVSRQIKTNVSRRRDLRKLKPEDEVFVVPPQDHALVLEGWVPATAFLVMPRAEWRRFALALEPPPTSGGEPGMWTPGSDRGEVWMVERFETEMQEAHRQQQEHLAQIRAHLEEIKQIQDNKKKQSY